jgi:hypothetical protein
MAQRRSKTEGVYTDIEALLDDAWVLVEDYDGYQGPSAAERIARAARRAEQAAARDPQEAAARAGGPAVAAPAHSTSEHEQAQYELDLTSTLVLHMPQAAGCLARLADERYIDAEGALIFACLLHLTDRPDAARFWWQFAAGGESHTAAYCLCLQHRCNAEFRDADYWRKEAQRLKSAGTPTGIRKGFVVDRPLLSDEVRQDILVQCHDGKHPRLPLAVEAVVNRLAVETDDPDFGEIPKPSQGLAGELARPGDLEQDSGAELDGSPKQDSDAEQDGSAEQGSSPKQDGGAGQDDGAAEAS